MIRKGLLPHLTPGDTLVVIRIDSESYRKDNVEAHMTLDVRPSKANAQKLQLASAQLELTASWGRSTGRSGAAGRGRRARRSMRRRTSASISPRYGRVR